jgi:predicted MPP superfamily phosphohydrolase
MIDGSVADLGDQVKELLNVKTPHGTYFCTGNHEYYSGALNWCGFLESQGVHVLNNQNRIIEVPGGKIMMAGVTDLHGARFIESHRCQPGLACENAPDDVDVKILLAHQPKVAFLTERGQYDLQLSGHTHGGQYFPYNFLIHLVQKYVAGMYRHEDMWVYVNRGTTFWGPPMRLGPEQEITLLKLTAAV